MILASKARSTQKHQRHLFPELVIENGAEGAVYSSRMGGAEGATHPTTSHGAPRPSGAPLTKDFLNFRVLKIRNSATLDRQKNKKLRPSSGFVVFLIARRTVLCTKELLNSALEKKTSISQKMS